MSGGNDAVAAIGALVDRCLAKEGLYGPRELEFLRSIGRRIVRGLTDKQLEWLTALAEREPLDFEKINRAALAQFHIIVARWLPGGHLRGKEYVARNPRRGDRQPGSFSINIANGKWGDFAADVRGGDPVSLAAYLFHDNDQIAAAVDLKRMLGA